MLASFLPLLGVLLAVWPVEGRHAARQSDPNYQEKYDLFIGFADAFMYPNNTAQSDAINSTLFAENIQGRVDLTNTFDGQELNTEVCLVLINDID